MINLTEKLSYSILVDGNFFKIKTDFRNWIKFDSLIRKNEDLHLSELFYLFEGKTIPTTNFYQQLFNFYSNPNLTPKYNTDYSGDVLIDYIEDGEFIYSDFIRYYNIDLIDIKYLHWHKFNALFRSLPEDSQIKSIIGIRGWEDNEKDYNYRMRILKEAWSFERIKSKEDIDKINEFEKYFS